MAKEDGIDLEAIIRVEKVPEKEARDKVRYLRGYEKRESSMTIKDANHQYHLHEQAIEAHTILTCKELGLSRDLQFMAGYLARWHDVGKLHYDIPSYIWEKTGKLDEKEWVYVKQHPKYSMDMLGILKTLGQGALCHHERFDGTGYPYGLKGEQIPKISLVVSVADCFSAMIHNRGYNVIKTNEEAARELLDCKGTQFDPESVDCFMKVLKFFGKIPETF